MPFIRSGSDGTHITQLVFSLLVIISLCLHISLFWIVSSQICTIKIILESDIQGTETRDIKTRNRVNKRKITAERREWIRKKVD